MVRGKTFFVNNPRLTPFQCGGFKTPGAGGAKTMYTVYEPVHENLPTGLVKEKLHDSATISHSQEGFGNPPINIAAMETETETSKKRKLDEGVFKKMQHPIYKVSSIKKPKVDLTIGKGASSTVGSSSTTATPSPSTSASSTAAASAPSLSSSHKSQKKYFKF